MIFLDANVFLRYLVQPTTPDVQAMSEAARSLFEAVERGEEEVTTTEVVLHEVAYVFASKRHYNLSAAEIAAALSTIIRLPELKLPSGRKRHHLRALDLYVAYPKLGLADAIVAASVENQGILLATFDSHFDGIPGIARWRPHTAGSP